MYNVLIINTYVSHYNLFEKVIKNGVGVIFFIILLLIIVHDVFI